MDKINLYTIANRGSLFFFLFVQIGTSQELIHPGGILYQEPKWEIVWSDEFDKPFLDKEKWFSYFPFTATGLDTCASCRTLMGSQFFTDTNFIFKNGILTCVAKRETVNWYGKEYSYTSGNLFSTQNVLYGKIEARIKIPKFKGMWPSFWTFGDGTEEEIDIFEITGVKANTIRSNYHNCYNVKKRCGKEKKHKVGDMSLDFHTYAVEWNPYFIHWYFDGKLIRTLPGYESKFSGTHIKKNKTRKGVYLPMDFFPTHKHRVIVGLGVGGNFPGFPDESTTFPDYMEIDYVRVYKDTVNVYN